MKFKTLAVAAALVISAVGVANAEPGVYVASPIHTTAGVRFSHIDLGNERLLHVSAYGRGACSVKVSKQQGFVPGIANTPRYADVSVGTVEYYRFVAKLQTGYLAVDADATSINCTIIDSMSNYEWNNLPANNGS